MLLPHGARRICAVYPLYRLRQRVSKIARQIIPHLTLQGRLLHSHAKVRTRGALVRADTPAVDPPPRRIPGLRPQPGAHPARPDRRHAAARPTRRPTSDIRLPLKHPARPPGGEPTPIAVKARQPDLACVVHSLSGYRNRLIPSYWARSSSMILGARLASSGRPSPCGIARIFFQVLFQMLARSLGPLARRSHPSAWGVTPLRPGLAVADDEPSGATCRHNGIPTITQKR